LEAWRRAIVDRHPEGVIRGCLDSDGCRRRRVVNGRNDPACSFPNSAADIPRLFTLACDWAGLRCRQSSGETISIARRPDVARLDALFDHAPDS
jgi:hypothetical protein